MDDVSGGATRGRSWPRYFVVIAVVVVVGLVAAGVFWRRSEDAGPALPITVAGLSQCELHGCVENLVDTVTGVLDLTTTDLAADRLTGEADVARRYRSDSTASGLFGVGWSSVTETRLERTPDAWKLVGGLGIPSAPSVVTGDPDGDHVVEFVDGTSWTFANPGFLTVMRSPGGEETHISRSTGEIRVDTPLGATVVLAVGSSGRVTSAVSPAGTASFNYDGDRLAGVNVTATPPEGTTTSAEDASRTSTYAYTDGHLSEAKEPARTVSVVYGPGSLVQRVTQDGQAFKLAYAPQQPTEVLPPGATKPTVYTHDTQGRLVSIRQGNVVVLEREFRNDGTLLGQEDSSGRTDYEWAAGQPVKVTKGDWVTELGYDDERRLSTIRTPDGSTTYAYDGPTARYPSQVTNPGGGVTQLSYEGDRIARQVDADGVETKIGWALADGKVNVASGSDPVASLRLSADGAVSQLDATSQPAGNAGDPADVLGNQRDQALRMNATAGQDGQPTGFDISNSKDKLTGRTFAYDDYGRITKIDAPRESVSISYDDRGRVASRKTGDDHTEIYGYDSSGHLTRTSVNGSATMTARYDGAGRIVDQTVNGENVNRRYDANGLVSELTDYRGTWKVTRTKAGKAQRITTPSGATIDFTYDEGGRLERVGTPTGAATSYGYDDAGRIAKVSRGGVDVTYGYRDDGKLARITSPLGIDNFDYDDAGRVNSTNGPSGTWAVDYDSDGRPAHLNEGSGSRDFTYDDLGKVLSVIDTRQGEDPVRTDYTYDDLGRVNGMNRGDDRTVIEYGPDGHPSKVSVAGDSETWQWTPTGHLQRVTAGDDNYDFNYENDRIKTVRRNDKELVAVDWSDQGPSKVAIEGKQLATLDWDQSRLSKLTFDRDTLAIERTGDGELSKLKIGDQVRAQVDWKDGIPTRTYSDDGEVSFRCAGTDCEFGTGPVVDGKTDDAKQVRLSYRAGVLTDATVDGLTTKFQAHPDGRIRSATRGDGGQERGEVTLLGGISGDLADLLTAVVGTDGVPNGPSTRTQFAAAPIVDSLPTELRPDGLDLETPGDRVQRTISSSIPTVPALRALDDDDTDIAISVLRDILTDTQVSVPFGPFGERSGDMFGEGGAFHHSGIHTDYPSVLSDDGWGAQYTQLSEALRPDPGLVRHLIDWAPTILGAVALFVEVYSPAFWALLGVAGAAAAGACFFDIGSCTALSATFLSVALPGPLGRLAKEGSDALQHFIADVVREVVKAGQAYVEGEDISVVGTAFACGVVLAAARTRTRLANGSLCKLLKVVGKPAFKVPETTAAHSATDGHRPARLLTVDRGGAAARRRAALAGSPARPGFDRDEYPFALTRHGGARATSNYVSPSENRSAGAFLRDELKDVKDGERFLFVVTDASSVTSRALEASGLAASRSLRMEAAGSPPG